MSDNLHVMRLSQDYLQTKDESSAFQLLYKLMNLYGYKDVYMGNLTILQLYLYQLSRLIYDFVPLLYQKLSQHDINPFFYAAPWFLTIFASQYPISFTARVFGKHVQVSCHYGVPIVLCRYDLL